MKAPRRPVAALRTTAIPALSAALAATATQGCESPACGPERVDELRAHGPSAVRAARRGEAEQTLREIAYAVGLRAHRATRVIDPELTPAGAAPVTQPTPPIGVAGEAAEVTTVPIEVPEVDGAVARVGTTPPAPPRIQPTQRVRPSGGAAPTRPHRDPVGPR